MKILSFLVATAYLSRAFSFTGVSNNIDKASASDDNSRKLLQTVEKGQSTAMIIVDMQQCFCNKTLNDLYVKGGDDLMDNINKIRNRIMDSSEQFDFMTALTQDWHPPDHVSFASSWKLEPFTSRVNVTYQNTALCKNPKNKYEPAYAIECFPSDEEQTLTQQLWPDHAIQNSFSSEFYPGMETIVQDKNTQIFRKGFRVEVDAYSGFQSNGGLHQTTMGEQLEGFPRLVIVGVAYDYCVKWTALDAANRGHETFVVLDATKAVDDTPEAMAATRKELMDAGVRVVSMEDIDGMFPL